MITAHFAGDRIISSSPLAFSFFEKSRFGEKKNGKIEYSGVEVLFLVSKKKMEVLFGKNKLDESMLVKKLKRRDKNIENKFVVFNDLRKKSYVVKTALKFGADFRVYDKSAGPGKDHARWLAFVVRESESMNWQEFAAKNRVAHSTKKNLLLCIIDEESDVTYYEVGWIKA